MREGWDYVRTFRPVRTILLLFALTSLMGYPYTVLLPVFAAQTLHGGRAHARLADWRVRRRRARVGAFAGMAQDGRRADAIAPRIGRGPRWRADLFGLSHTLWLSLVLMVFAGFGLIQIASASNTIIQTLVAEDKRARVMSYYTMTFFGAAPIGSLAGGDVRGTVRRAGHGHCYRHRVPWRRGVVQDPAARRSAR